MITIKASSRSYTHGTVQLHVTIYIKYLQCVLKVLDKTNKHKNTPTHMQREMFGYNMHFHIDDYIIMKYF